MNRALAIVTVLSLFVAGIAIGALGMHIYQDQRLRHPGRPDETIGFGPGFVGRRLHRVLDLSTEQMEKIDAILERSHEQAMELRRNVHPRVMEIMDRAHEEIAGILDVEQQEKFRQLLQENRRRAEQFFLGPPGDRGGHGRHRSWGGPGRRPWGPPPGGSPDGPPPEQPDDPTPGEPGDTPPDQTDVPGRT